MSVFAKGVLLAGLVKLVLRTIWAQLQVPRGNWVTVSGSQRLGEFLTGMLCVMNAIPSVFGCWIGLRMASDVMGMWPPAAGIAIMLGIVLVILYGAAQLAIILLAAAFINFVMAWRGAKPPTDLFTVIMATNWTDVR